MEESGTQYQGRWIIRLGKEPDENGDPDVEAVYLDQKKDAFKRDFKAFLAAKALYDWQQANRSSYKR